MSRARLKIEICASLIMVLVSVCWAGSAFAESDQLSVKALGLRVVTEGYGQSANMPGFPELQALNSKKGTTVSVLVKSETGGLIAVDEDQSKISSFVDSSGKNLYDGKEFGKGRLSFPKISKDGKAIVFDVAGGDLPVSTAQQVKVEGEIVVKAATKKKEFKSEPLDFKAGAAVEKSVSPLSVSSVGKPKWGDDPFEIYLQLDSDNGSIHDVKFFDSDNRLVESREASRSSFGQMGGAKKSTIGYSLKKKIEKGYVAYSYWTDISEIKKDISLLTGIGLSASEAKPAP